MADGRVFLLVSGFGGDGRYEGAGSAGCCVVERAVCSMGLGQASAEEASLSRMVREWFGVFSSLFLVKSRRKRRLRW